MDDTAALLQLEGRRCDAMMAVDAGALDLLFSDRMTWIHSSARQDTKASLIAGLQAGATRYLTMNRFDEQVSVYGSFAVITGLVEMRANIGGQDKNLRNRYTNVWEKTADSWRMVAWQSTAAPAN